MMKESRLQSEPSEILPENLDNIYDAFPGGIGEIPAIPQIPMNFSLGVPGITSGNFAQQHEEVVHGKVGKKIVELRDKELHVATQVRPGKVVFWASEHRPLVAATVAMSLTAATAAGVILYRKSRQKHRE